MELLLRIKQVSESASNELNLLMISATKANNIETVRIIAARIQIADISLLALQHCIDNNNLEIFEFLMGMNPTTERLIHVFYMAAEKDRFDFIPALLRSEACLEQIESCGIPNKILCNLVLRRYNNITKRLLTIPSVRDNLYLRFIEPNHSNLLNIAVTTGNIEVLNEIFESIKDKKHRLQDFIQRSLGFATHDGYTEVYTFLANLKLKDLNFSFKDIERIVSYGHTQLFIVIFSNLLSVANQKLINQPERRDELNNNMRRLLQLVVSQANFYDHSSIIQYIYSLQDPIVLEALQQIELYRNLDLATDNTPATVFFYYSKIKRGEEPQSLPHHYPQNTALQRFRHQEPTVVANYLEKRVPLLRKFIDGKETANNFLYMMPKKIIKRVIESFYPNYCPQIKHASKSVMIISFSNAMRRLHGLSLQRLKDFTNCALNDFPFDDDLPLMEHILETYAEEKPTEIHEQATLNTSKPG